jgi:LPXTG-motif cell wall-anchored protein
VELERYGEGFLYSELPVDSPTPSPELTPLVEAFPTSLVFIASVGIALAAIGLLVYLKKRQRNKGP